MTDTNLPVHHNVVDLSTGAVVASGLPHADAVRVCEGLEPVLIREDGWRYVIEPVRGVAA